jgi:hypothetical protein
MHNGNTVGMKWAEPVASCFQPAAYRFPSYARVHSDGKCFVEIHYGTFFERSRNDVSGYQARLTLGASDCWGGDNGAYNGRGQNDRYKQYSIMPWHTRLLLFCWINNDLSEACYT